MALALQFSGEGAQLLQNYAARNQVDLSEFVLRAALEKIEDEAAERKARDRKELDAAMDKFEQKKGSPLTEEDLPQLVDMLADIRVEQIAAERLAHPSGKTFTFEEVLAECGITQEELDAMPEVEIE